MEHVSTLFSLIFGALWFMLPAYIGNIAPLFVKKIPLLETPVDFGFSVGGKRLFGDHKTWRGIIVGVAVGALVSYLQQRPFSHGAILALGNFTGDLIGAFIKRQLNIPSGGKSVYIDSIPSPVFTILAASAAGFLTLSFPQVMIAVFGIIPLHILANRFWHKIHVKSVPW